MTQEEKDLLLKDLCARLLYGTKVCYRLSDKDKYTTETLSGHMLDYFNENSIIEVKPYLRPMSSMTEEEKKTLWEELDKDMEILGENIDAQIINVYKGRCYRGNPVYHEIDFLNKNHFDWRGLIPMGLAIEAPENLYKN